MSCSYGIFLSFVSLLDQSLDILEYSNPGKATSVNLVCAITVGVFSSFGFSNAIKKTKKYK